METICIQCQYFKSPNSELVGSNSAIRYNDALKIDDELHSLLNEVETDEYQFARQYGYLSRRPCVLPWCAFLSADQTRLDPVYGRKQIFIPVFIANPAGKCDYFKARKG